MTLYRSDLPDSGTAFIMEPNDDDSIKTQLRGSLTVSSGSEGFIKVTLDCYLVRLNGFLISSSGENFAVDLKETRTVRTNPLLRLSQPLSVTTYAGNLKMSADTLTPFLNPVLNTKGGEKTWGKRNRGKSNFYQPPTKKGFR